MVIYYNHKCNEGETTIKKTINQVLIRTDVVNIVLSEKMYLIRFKELNDFVKKKQFECNGN
jgi:hypothetical protein